MGGSHEDPSLSACLHGWGRGAECRAAGRDYRTLRHASYLPIFNSGRARDRISDGPGSQPIWPVEHIVCLVPAASPPTHWLTRGPPSLFGGTARPHHRHIAGLFGCHRPRVGLVPGDDHAFPVCCDLVSWRPDRLLPRLEVPGWVLQRTIG